METDPKAAAQAENLSDKKRFDTGFTRLLEQSEVERVGISNRVRNADSVQENADPVEQVVKDRLHDGKSAAGLISQAGAGAGRSLAEMPDANRDGVEGLFSEQSDDKK